jgi:hypothetical protein
MRSAYRNLGEKPHGRNIHGTLRFTQANGTILDLTNIMSKHLKQIQCFSLRLLDKLQVVFVYIIYNKKRIMWKIYLTFCECFSRNTSPLSAEFLVEVRTEICRANLMLPMVSFENKICLT